MENHSIVKELANVVKEDLIKIKEESEKESETTIYHRVLPSNPKPYPISGLQHFFGTAFVALRLTEFSGLDEEKQITAFLAGLLHDYEKMGLKRDEIVNGMSYTIGVGTMLYAELEGYENVWNDAVEIASNLESGGVRRELQNIAEFVRLGDYLTGGEESWNISYVIDVLKTSLDLLGVEHHLVPVVIGRQRPLVALVAEKLEEEIEKSSAVPLLSTPTGLVVISKYPVTSVRVDDIYKSLTQHVVSISPTVAVSPQSMSEKPKVNLDVVETIIEFLNNMKDIKNKLNKIKPLFALSKADLEKAKMSAVTLDDKKKLIIYLIISFAKASNNKVNDETVREVMDSFGIDVTGDTLGEMIRQLYKDQDNSVERVNELIESVYSRAVEYIANLTRGKDIEESVANILRKTVGIGFMRIPPSDNGDVTCSICREKFKKSIGRTLYEQLQVESRIKSINIADVFHPDKQGKPENISSMDGSSKRMYVCPVCFFETKVLADVDNFADGMWASSIVYYPAMSIDLLQVVKDVASNYVVVGYTEAKRRKKEEKIKTLVIPDYISSRIIVKTSDNQGGLGKKELVTALNLWYFIGGSLVLTTNALSVPTPWSGLPIEMEISDVIIEESINKFMEELKNARERNEWTRTRLLRKILYEQLRTYILNLEEAERKMGKTKFMKSGLNTSNAPALDVYSFMIGKHTRTNIKRG